MLYSPACSALSTALPARDSAPTRAVLAGCNSSSCSSAHSPITRSDEVSSLVWVACPQPASPLGRHECCPQHLQGVGHRKMAPISEKNVCGITHLFDREDMRRIEEDSFVLCWGVWRNPCHANPWHTRVPRLWYTPQRVLSRVYCIAAVVRLPRRLGHGGGLRVLSFHVL
jgi:hypothetical protein